MGDSADKSQPSVKLSFGQIVGLGLFILTLIGGSVKLLYDAIDKRLDKIEEKIDKHDGRLDGIDQKVSVQEVKIEHLMQMQRFDKDDGDEGAEGSDEEDEGVEGAGVEASPRIARRRTRRARRSGSSWTPRSDLYQRDCRTDLDCPRHHACHSGKCWPPGGGEGGPPGADEGGPPSEPDEPPPDRMAMAAPEHDPDTVYDGATSMVVETDIFETRRERRKRERCEKKWRKGCPPPEVNLADNLRKSSDQLALMQLREASNRLAKLQRKEQRRA